MSGGRKTVNPLHAPNFPGAEGLPLSSPENDGTLLNGIIKYRQFRHGYRTGIEPVLLASAIPAKPGETILEGGCGAGAALLCLATRVPGITGIGLEADPETVDLANHNFQINHQENLTALHAILPDIPPSLRTQAPNANGRFHHVMANPPWHNSTGTPSPNSRRRLALSAENNDPQEWIKTLTKWVLPGGTLTFIISAAITDRACQTLLTNGAGSLHLHPLWPKQNRDAKLVLIQATQGGRGIFRLHPGLTLHENNGTFTPAANGILREGKNF